ncbi:Cytadherence high molecular weight protein 2, partial [Diplonema papillatum]
HDTTAGEMAALRAECNDLRMQLQKQRQLASLEDSTKFEARLSEQRKQADTAREKERKSAQEGADRLVAEADRRADNRIHDVTREYESQLTTLKQQLGADKDRHQVDLLRKDEEAAKQQEALSQQLHLKMDTLLTELKAVYERKWRHIQEQELERAAAADKRKIEFEAMTRSNYDRLLKEAEQAHAQALEKRETHRAAADKERDRAVAQLRQELDMTRLNEADEIEARVRERVADLSRQALEEKAEYMRMAETERDKREAAEGSVAGLQMEIDRLSSSMTQWKLELHKSLVSKYENLFNEVQSRARKDREAFARKLLEEEERRLARELVRKDAELTRSRNESERLASSEAETREQRVRQLERHQHMKRLFEAFGSRREKLLKLWALIDTDPTERMQLMNAMFSQLGKLTVPTSPSPDVSPNRLPPDDLSNHLIEVVTKVYEEVCSEIQRLEAQLPLMDIITRREFVKHRVSEVAAAGPSNLRDRQIADLRRELHKLNEQLLHDLPQYEQEHNAKLFYKNQRYLLVMEQDMQREQQQQMAGTGVPFPS